MGKPNVVYIHSHDSGRYVQPYGYAVPTPNIQRLAQESTLFRQAFSVAPTCSPSRAGLLTGEYPHECGMLGLAHRGFSLNDPSKHLVHTLRPAGYTTALAGVQHVAKDPAEIGYDQILPAASRGAADVAPAAARFVAAATGPFFLDVGFTQTHRPYPEPGPEDDPRYVLPPAPLPDTPQTRADMAAYHASARQLDAGVGVVLDAIDAAGLRESTLVICTTDHGLAFPHMKSNLTDHGLGVMLMLRGPGGFGGGAVAEAMVSHLDVFPTVCEVAGLAPPERLRGTSLTPLAAGGAARLHEEVFGEVTYHAAYEPQRTVRTDRYRYVRRFEDRDRLVAPNVDAGPSKALLVERGWRERDRPAEMLFDLTFDPQEARNLAGDPAAAGVLADLRGRLRRWMESTGDPLLDGPVPAPAGAVVDDQDGDEPGGSPGL